VVEGRVGLKWFARGLQDGALGFAGEESSGASVLRRDGSAWTTDKDGMIVGLLAAKITARAGTTPAVSYECIANDLGPSWSSASTRPLRRMSGCSWIVSHRVV